MLRRLSLVLLLAFLPTPLTAQGFGLFAAPGGRLGFRWFGFAAGNEEIPNGEELYLLDAAGHRVKKLVSINTGVDYFNGFLGTFAPGEQFGFEWMSLASGLSDLNPVVLGGDLSQYDGLILESVVSTGRGNATLQYAAYDATLANPHPMTAPEPVSMALLATGLLGLGAVGWRRKQGAV